MKNDYEIKKSSISQIDAACSTNLFSWTLAC